MKKAMWLASVVCLAVAAWATTVSVPAQAGSYAAQESSENGELARHRGGSSGGSSYGSSGGRSRSRGNHGSSGGRSRRSRGSHGSHGSHG